MRRSPARPTPRGTCARGGYGEIRKPKYPPNRYTVLKAKVHCIRRPRPQKIAAGDVKKTPVRVPQRSTHAYRTRTRLDTLVLIALLLKTPRLDIPHGFECILSQLEGGCGMHLGAAGGSHAHGLAWIVFHKCSRMLYGSTHPLFRTLAVPYPPLPYEAEAEAKAERLTLRGKGTSAGTGTRT